MLKRRYSVFLAPELLDSLRKAAMSEPSRWRMGSVSGLVGKVLEERFAGRIRKPLPVLEGPPPFRREGWVPVNFFLDPMLHIKVRREALRQHGEREFADPQQLKGWRMSLHGRVIAALLAERYGREDMAA